VAYLRSDVAEKINLGSHMDWYHTDAVPVWCVGNLVAVGDRNGALQLGLCQMKLTNMGACWRHTSNFQPEKAKSNGAARILHDSIHQRGKQKPVCGSHT